jgi:hypothetical protein
LNRLWLSDDVLVKRATLIYNENKVGPSARITGFERRLKLAANGDLCPDQSRLQIRVWNYSQDCGFQTALVLGPVQDPVNGSNNQPLFSTAHPGSGAPFFMHRGGPQDHERLIIGK